MTLKEACVLCKGNKRIPACDECGGTGEQDCAPRPDLDRAQRYIAEQRQAQEHRADTAVSIVRWRFLVLGAVLYREHDDLLSFQGRLIYIGHRSRGRSYERKANPHQAELIINPDLIQTEMELCDLVDDFVSSFDRGLLSLAEGYNADEEQRA